LALDGNEWAASHPNYFTRGTHRIGVWEGSRAGLDAVGREKTPIAAPAGNRTPVVQHSQVTI